MSAYTIRDEDFEKWKWPTDLEEVAALGRRVFGTRFFVVNDEDFRWGVCQKNSVTEPIDELARNVAVIESVRGQPSKESNLCLYESLIADTGIFEKAILENDSRALRSFADAIDQYKDGFTDLDYEEQAILYLLSASRIFYLERRGEAFTKGELKARALLLWARMRCRSKGMGKLGDDDPKIQNELAIIGRFGVNWTRVYHKIGLHGVKQGKPGPKLNS